MLGWLKNIIKLQVVEIAFLSDGKANILQNDQIREIAERRTTAIGISPKCCQLVQGRSILCILLINHDFESKNFSHHSFLVLAETLKQYYKGFRNRICLKKTV